MTGRKVSFNQACRIIQDGGVVALPTETVYGLAGSIHSESALRQIFQIKKRPLFDPLIVHFAEKKQLKEICKYNHPIVEKLSDYFHPGPLSLVLRKKTCISPLITAKSNKVAVRMPKHPLTLKLMLKTKTCLACPSANLFSKTSPTRAGHVLESLKIPVLDGGACNIGIESTIVEIIEDKKQLSILRPGIISKTDLENFLHQNHLNWTVAVQTGSSTMPGQNKQHYQPDIPFVIVQPSRKKISLKNLESQIKKHYPDRSPLEFKLKKDPLIFSRELYHNLRRLSKNQQSVGYVIKKNEYSQGGVWQAIWDRLEKASHQTLRAP